VDLRHKNTGPDTCVCIYSHLLCKNKEAHGSSTPHSSDPEGLGDQKSGSDELRHPPQGTSTISTIHENNWEAEELHCKYGFPEGVLKCVLNVAQKKKQPEQVLVQAYCRL
jgi:hypothetical protein